MTSARDPSPITVRSRSRPFVGLERPHRTDRCERRQRERDPSCEERARDADRERGQQVRHHQLAATEPDRADRITVAPVGIRLASQRLPRQHEGGDEQERTEDRERDDERPDRVLHAAVGRGPGLVERPPRVQHLIEDLVNSPWLGHDRGRRPHAQPLVVRGAERGREEDGTAVLTRVGQGLDDMLPDARHHEVLRHLAGEVAEEEADRELIARIELRGLGTTTGDEDLPRVVGIGIAALAQHGTLDIDRARPMRRRST